MKTLIKPEEMLKSINAIGCTGKGRSSFIEAEANQRGISYEEMEKLLEPTEEEKESKRKKEEDKRLKKWNKLNKFKTLYWNELEDKSDLYAFEDALICELEIVDPTEEMIKIVFMEINSHVFGQGVSWGFDDTVVREYIHEFVEDNKIELQKKLKDLK